MLWGAALVAADLSKISWHSLTSAASEIDKTACCLLLLQRTSKLRLQ